MRHWKLMATIPTVVLHRPPLVGQTAPRQASAAQDTAALRPVDQLGRPLRELRVSVTDRCNFRCDYCMPAALFADERRFLPNRELLTFDEIERVVRVAAEDLGVVKVRLTGGEPLLRPHLSELVARLARLPSLDELTLTTNGLLLAQHAPQLKAAGLDRITVSLDSLDPLEFARMSGGIDGLARVLAGIDAASAAGFGAIKLNCVVVRGQNEGAVTALAQRFRGTPHIVRFIEYMDVGTQNRWRAEQVIDAREITATLARHWPLEALPPNYAGEVARRYRYLDGAGEVGVIASVSEPFCGKCHRARLSADGRLLTCLFAETGTPLKPALREHADDGALRDLLCDTWRARGDRYSEARSTLAAATPRRRLEMYQVGG
ncbi:MAG: GTP 3',8-cyclase MoaA [Polyangiales bacterium]